LVRQEAFGFSVGTQQCLDSPAEFFVGTASVCQEGCSFGSGELERGVEDGFDLDPARIGRFIIHHVAPTLRGVLSSRTGPGQALFF
jgi:hypothetical protein